MSRKEWVQDPKTLRMVPAEEWRVAPRAEYTVIPDIGDFQTPEGFVLNGRKALREDLALKNCHVYERGERQHIEAMRAQNEHAERVKLRRVIGDIAAERGLGVPD